MTELKTIYPWTVILLVVMAGTSLLLLGQPAGTFASTVEVIGGDFELRVRDTGEAGMDNMAPGDTEYSTIAVENQGKEAFDLAVTVVKEEGDDGLFDALQVSIFAEGNILLHEEAMGQIQGLALGTITGGEEREYTFRVEFPKEAGNEYQGIDLTMKWLFTATWPEEPGEPSPPSPRPSPSPGPGPAPEDEDVEEIDGEEVPEAPVEPEEPEEDEEEELVPIDDDEVPDAPAELPRTGEIPPLVFYSLGLALVAAGAVLGRRRR